MSEHIWLADVQYTGGRFVGYVDNKPVNIKGLKLGDKESVNPDEISDWLYIDHGKLVGGYTVRVLYSELSPKEKQEFTRKEPASAWSPDATFMKTIKFAILAGTALTMVLLSGCADGP